MSQNPAVTIDHASIDLEHILRQLHTDKTLDVSRAALFRISQGLLPGQSPLFHELLTDHLIWSATLTTQDEMDFDLREVQGLWERGFKMQTFNETTDTLVWNDGTDATFERLAKELVNNPSHYLYYAHPELQPVYTNEVLLKKTLATIVDPRSA